MSGSRQTGLTRILLAQIYGFGDAIGVDGHLLLECQWALSLRVEHFQEL